jgi:hypothetical protein
MADKSPEAAKSKPKDDDTQKQQDLAFDEAQRRYHVGMSTDGLPYAVPSNPRLPKVAKPIAELASELMLSMHRAHGIMLGREAMDKVLKLLTALAMEHGQTPVYLRSAPVGTNAFHIDLGDPAGRYVEISQYGWTVFDPLEDREDDPVAITAARPVFRRTAATGALPPPVAGGSRDLLRELLDLPEDDTRWMLIWGWLVAAFFSEVPRPILWALGPQGSGKSTRARMVLNMVDPAEALGSAPGNSLRDDFVSAAGRFIPSWDNIGTVSAKTSNWMCQIVTKIADDHRKMYSDAGLHIQTIRRSGVATSIVLPFGLGPDALERLVLVELERVAETERRAESQLWADFHRLHPRIFGALLDDVAGALRHLEAVKADKTIHPPRMADYAQILYALDAHLGIDRADGYAAAYVASVHTVMADRAESDPLTRGLLAIARAKGNTWHGTVDDLLRRLEPYRPDDYKAAWPTSPVSLGGALIRGQETLRAVGLTVERRKVRGVRSIVLHASPADPDDNEEPTPEPEQSGPSTTPAPETSPGVGGANLDDVLS